MKIVINLSVILSYKFTFLAVNFYHSNCVLLFVFLDHLNLLSHYEKVLKNLNS